MQDVAIIMCKAKNNICPPYIKDIFKPDKPRYGLENSGDFLIDHFTDTAAILNKLDLMSIMGFPGGINIDLLCTNSVITPFWR